MQFVSQVFCFLFALSSWLFNVISFTALSRVGEQFNHQKNSFSPEKIQWRFKHEKFCDIFRLGEIQTFSPVPPLSTSYSPKFSATCLATSRRLFIITKHVPQTSDKSYLTRSKSFWPNCRRARSVSRLVSQLDGLAQSKDLKFSLSDDEISPPSRRGAHTKRKFIRFYKSFFRCSLRDDRERRDSFSLFKSLWKILSHFSSRSPEKELTVMWTRFSADQSIDAAHHRPSESRTSAHDRPLHHI